ncbi:hypothetical protein LIP84_01510 [Roseburia faecis]|uniref:hypothetical protein n=1 Tax=Roseburia faecis TaxID=301302 RepID=UPI001D01A0AF|nr:hypothetical protein [Roseburia faecis]MCB5476899.1 hypothetical protein [Roseburia faecis]
MIHKINQAIAKRSSAPAAAYTVGRAIIQNYEFTEIRERCPRQTDRPQKQSKRCPDTKIKAEADSCKFSNSV